MNWKDEEDPPWWAPVLGVTVLAVGIYAVSQLMPWLDNAIKADNLRYRNAHIEAGRNARRAGVPAEANPNYWTYERRLWLEGWAGHRVSE